MTEINHEDDATAAIDTTAETAIIETEAEVAAPEVAAPVEHDAPFEVIEESKSDEEIKSEAEEAIAA